MGKFAIIVGIPGVGKTTVLESLLKLASEQKLRVSIENMGTLMLEAAREAGLSLQRDEMRNLPLEEQRKLRIKAIEKLSIKKDLNDLTILDTHFLIRSKGGYLIGLPKNLLDAMRPEFFGIIEAPVSDIIYRREKDSARMRDVVTEEEVKLEQDLTRASIFVLAAIYSANVVRVLNEHGKARKAAEELFDFMLRG